MATDIAQDLEDQLAKTKVALQGQAEEMLALLLQFEARLQERLNAAEARIAALRAAEAQDLGKQTNGSIHSNDTCRVP